MSLFSVVIPAYNHARYIRQAIESVLAQTVDLEVIVVDDASSDDTWAEIQSFADDARVRAFRHERNQGAHVTLNEGAALANGRYLAFLNSDDYFSPSRLGRALEVFTASPDIDAVFSHYEFVDAESALSRSAGEIADEFPVLDEALFSGLDGLDEKKRQLLLLLQRNYLHTSSNLICRREVFERLGGFRPFRYVHDHEFFLRLAFHCRIEVMSESLLSYRFHGSNTISENGVRSVAETGAMLVDFLAVHPLPGLDGTLSPLGLAVATHVFGRMNWYGGERWSLLLAATCHGLDAEARLAYFEGLLRNQAVIAPDLAGDISRDQREKELAWQQAQAEKWWRACQQAEEAQRWQKTQTDEWWRACMEAQASLQETSDQLARQEWAREQLEQHNAYLAGQLETWRWLGLPLLWARLRRRFFGARPDGSGES